MKGLITIEILAKTFLYFVPVNCWVDEQQHFPVVDYLVSSINPDEKS
jgi:hypothetical protein